MPSVLKWLSVHLFFVTAKNPKMQQIQISFKAALAQFNKHKFHTHISTVDLTCVYI